MISVCITPESISLNVNGRPFSIRKDHPMFLTVVNGLKKGEFDVDGGEDKLVDLLTPKAMVARFVAKAKENEVELVDDVVLYKGKPVHNSLTQKVLEFAEAGFPVEPLLNFLNRMMNNPSMSARDELFDFLDHKQLPITPDGCFLAYKAVRSDGYDIHSGTVHYAVGSVVEMARADVDDDRRKGCSYGLHAGTLSYVRSFGNSGSKYLTVKIDPADVVSVPLDCGCQKLRTWKMQVVGEFQPDWVGFEDAYYDDTVVGKQVLVTSNVSEDEDEDDYVDSNDTYELEYEAGAAMAKADSLTQYVNKYHVVNKYKNKSDAFYEGYNEVMDDLFN